MLILVVDDERAIREGLKAILNSAGYKVRTASDGYIAIRSIREVRPDLVLMDVMMPRMDGITACKEIRKTDEILPILFLTAFDSDQNELKALRVGADDFLSKDVPEEVLIRKIERALKRTGAKESKALAKRIELGQVTIDLAAFIVLENGKKIAELTKAEAQIFLKLLEKRGEWLTAEDFETTDVRRHIHNLRGKMGVAGDMLRSERTRGYTLVK